MQREIIEICMNGIEGLFVQFWHDQLGQKRLDSLRHSK